MHQLLSQYILLSLLFLCVYAVNPATVNLGTAATYGVLAGAGVTSSGATVVYGDLGTSPTASITGAPTVYGVIHAADSTALQAQGDLLTAYNDCVGRTSSTVVGTELGGTTVVPGVIKTAAGDLQITGNITLDGQNLPNAVFIFQAATTLNTAFGAFVLLVNGTQAHNVFWQIGSSATLSANTSFEGTILAQTAITIGASSVVNGRALARNAAVTMTAATITTPTASTAIPTTPPPSTSVSPSPSPLSSGVNSIATTTMVTSRPTATGCSTKVDVTFAILSACIVSLWVV